MYNYKKLETNTYGLKFRPTLNPQHDTADCIVWNRNPPQEFSADNHSVLLYELKRLGDKCKCIVEIGVHRGGANSSTCTLMDEKPLDCIYLGVDIEDKSYLNDPARNIYTIKTDSRDRAKVFARLDELGAKGIDLFFIDGWHSIEYVCDYDWTYVERLSPHGVVLSHDVSMHPGPYCHYDAVDEAIFDKEKYFTTLEENDFGIAVFRKR